MTLKKQVADRVKKGIKAIKDGWANLGKTEVAMDKEEQIMVATIKARTKASSGRSEGVRSIKFTGDDNERAAFQRQNDLLREKKVLDGRQMPRLGMPPNFTADVLKAVCTSLVPEIGLLT